MKRKTPDRTGCWGLCLTPQSGINQRAELSMNDLVITTAATMTSRDYEAESMALVLGDAPNEVAYETAFKSIAYAAKLAGEFDTGDLDHMSREEAHKALDRIESGRKYLRDIAPMFDEYPLVKMTIKNLLNTMFYAEATLIPFYLCCNQSVAGKKNARTRTYIVKHPLTGLLKIGRSVDVEGRIKSLQTGAGAILSVMAVLDGDRETELHGKFSHLREHGEWFADRDGEISAFLEGQEVAV